MNYEQLLDSFLQFEDESSMFQIRVSGIKIWHYIRQSVFEDILDYLENNRILKPKGHQVQIIKRTVGDVFRENVICNQFFAHKRDVLIFPNAGKNRDENGYYRCIYTDLLDKKMKKSHYLLDGKSLRGIYEKSSSKNILYIDLDKFEKMSQQKHRYKAINKGDIEKKIIIPIEEFFNIKVSLGNKREWIKLIYWIVQKREVYMNYYSYMLQKITPKVIIVTSAVDCDKMFLCEIAKRKKIPVVELQHGLIGRTHIGYNFRKKMNLPSFPDYIFTYGQFDKFMARFPLADERIIPVGFPELESYCRRAQNVSQRERKSILFISQQRSEIAQWAEVVAGILDKKRYRVIYKLHPIEYGNWKKIYNGCLNNSNIEIVGDDSTTIYDFLREADWVVGLYSTVLFEATMFKCKIAIIQEELSIAAQDLYNNGYAILASSPQKLAEEITEDDFEKKSEFKLQIFERNSIQNMLDWIDRIIRENEY